MGIDHKTTARYYSINVEEFWDFQYFIQEQYIQRKPSGVGELSPGTFIIVDLFYSIFSVPLK
jgi:hypothetical protein